jgi:hypothetical protein
MAVNWSQIQALCEPTLETHWARCWDELALDCPIGVFEELFFEHHGDQLFADLCRAVDPRATRRSCDAWAGAGRMRKHEDHGPAAFSDRVGRDRAAVGAGAAARGAADAHRCGGELRVGGA